MIPANAPGPHICNLMFGGKTPVLPQEQPAAMGYAGIVYADAALQASLAMNDVLKHIRTTGPIDGIENAVRSLADRQRMVNFDHYRELERRCTEARPRHLGRGPQGRSVKSGPRR